MARLVCIAACLALVSPATAGATVELSSNGRGDQVLLHRVLVQHGRPLFAATRTPGGAFGPLAPISAPEVGGFVASAIVDDAGGSVTLWSTVGRQGEPEGAPKVVTRAPGGSFGAPLEVVPGENGPVTLAGNAEGDAIAALSPYTGAGQYRFRAAGSDFGPVAELPGKNAFPVGMAVDPDGSALFVWSEYKPGQHVASTFMSVRPPHGDFGARQELPVPDAARDVGFSAARNGRALLVWDEGAATKAMEREPGGNFGPAVEVLHEASAAGSSRSVALAPSGAAAILYDDFTRSYLVTRGPGGAFGAPEPVGGAAWSLARMALDDRGDVALVSAGGNHVLRSRYRPAAGPLGATRRLSPARPFAPGLDYPGLAIDDSGRATAGWEQSDGDTIRTFTRDFDAAGSERAVLVDSVPSLVREGPPETCRPPGAPVLASSAHATVFDAGFQAGGVKGCLLARGTPVPLVFDIDEHVQPTGIDFAGPLVSYASDYSGHSSSNTSLNVVDLRDPDGGVNRHVSPDGWDHNSILAVSRLRANGAVAWIGCPSTFTRSEAKQTCMRPGGMLKLVYAWDAHAAKLRPLDAGRRIDPRTLRLRGSRLTWRNRGKLHHATLR